MLYDFLLACEL